MPPKKRCRDGLDPRQTTVPAEPKAKRRRGESAAGHTGVGKEGHGGSPSSATLTKYPTVSRPPIGEEVESDACSSSSTRAARVRDSRSPSAADAGGSGDQYGDLFSQLDTITQTVDAEFAEVERRKHAYALRVKKLDELRAAFAEAQVRARDIVAARHPQQSCDALALNVGGVRFVVPASTLLGRDEDSYFHSLLQSSHDEVPVFLDNNNDVFIDRDPEVFRLVLRYLRGSNHFDMLDEEQLAKLKVDAAFFRLENLSSLLTEPPKELDHLLLPGPGVSIEQNRLRVMYCVGIVGDTQLVTGRHRITFEIMAAEYAGVGLVSEACITQDQEFHKTMNCCVYYMSGVFYANFPHHRKEETLEKFESGDFVSILVDLDKGFAEFTLKNTSKVISLGRARRLRFATTLKLGSRVRIVPEAEVAQLGLNQPRPSLPAPELHDDSEERVPQLPSDLP